MARRRSADHDYICIRCGCPTDVIGSKHLGAGPGRKACDYPPNPMLRRDYDAMILNDLRGIFGVGGTR